jgi:hypothetical protein
VSSTEAPPRYETGAAIDNVVRLLALPYDRSMQDWNVELADHTRLGEFCSLYESSQIGNDTRFALMQLIIASLDDWYWLADGASRHEEGPARVERLLRRDFMLHLHTLDYWRVKEEADPDNVFAVTPLVRRVWDDCYKPEYDRWLNEGA